MQFPNNKGEITSHDLLVTAAITIAAGILVFVAFIILSNRSQKAGQDDATLDLINQIKEQSRRDAGGAGQEPEGEDAGEVAAEETTITGALTRVNGDALTVTDQATSAQYSILLTQDTVMTYNGGAFNKSDFYAGDMLSARIVRSENAWEAISITVIFSASPNTSAPVPTGLQERPDGSLKPL